MLLTDEKNPYRKPIRDGVTWNKEVITAFNDGAKAQLREVVETISPDSEYTKAMVWANPSMENTIRYTIETLRRVILEEIK